MTYRGYAENELTKRHFGQFDMLTARNTEIRVTKHNADLFSVGPYPAELSLTDAIRVLCLSQEEHLLAGPHLDGKNTGSVIAFVKSIYRKEDHD